MVVKQEIEYLEKRLKQLYDHYQKEKITYKKYITQFSDIQRELEKKKKRRERISKRDEKVKSYEKTKKRLGKIPKTKIKTGRKDFLKGIPKGRKLY